MSTKVVRNRWTNKEINLAKEALKLTNGNQKKAAIILTNQLDRSLASIQVRLCTLAKKHPSLRKANIIRKKKVQTDETSSIRKVKNVIFKDNTLTIIFE